MHVKHTSAAPPAALSAQAGRKKPGAEASFGELLKDAKAATGGLAQDLTPPAAASAEPGSSSNIR